jgi:hypothetical protein
MVEGPGAGGAGDADGLLCRAAARPRCGTIVGKLAGRWRERRWRVHVAAIMCTLLVALPPVAALHSAASAFAMVIVSLAIAVPASVMLERSTRPDEPVPLARVS